MRFNAVGGFNTIAKTVNWLENNCSLTESPGCNETNHALSTDKIAQYAKKYCLDANLKPDLPVPQDVVYLCIDLIQTFVTLDIGFTIEDPNFEFTSIAKANGHDISWVTGQAMQYNYDILYPSQTSPATCLCCNSVLLMLSLALAVGLTAQFDLRNLG
ncbi:hypothetical protein Ciccas_012021 [Cichlidogyrus casuarinus]|uniref:Uncharacterized protein n=1 Tax=Cichlidogyrus casuarinus TaxID=1844966 RepID=A0ABD2PQU3_9PLAT